MREKLNIFRQKNPPTQVIRHYVLTRRRKLEWYSP